MVGARGTLAVPMLEEGVGAQEASAEGSGLGPAGIADAAATFFPARAPGASMVDEKVPERAKLGNEDRPDRVPPEGHEGAVRVPEKTWQANNRRRDTAAGLVDEQQPQE